MVKLQFRKSIPFGALLNLLLPGLGHVYWKDYMFGIFVFLVMLIAAALFFVSFLVTLPGVIYWLLFGLPVVFFVFTFFDLAKTIRKRRGSLFPSTARWSIFLAVGVAYQLFAPIAAVNFGIRNRPSIYKVANNQLYPVFKNGQYVRASHLAYSADLFFLKGRLYYRLPERFDIVSFKDTTGVSRFGVVVGLPGEEVEVAQGVVIANGYPQVEPSTNELLTGGDLALTSVERSSILVVTLYFGKVDRAYDVALKANIGKVEPLL
jgi:hypothetical protein